MKNFKKVLALVLAVVMLLSFATVASAVTSSYYEDADDINYTEAVDVLGAIGVLNGFPDDTFRPEATITRAQAAKIIAMFDNGSTDINKLYAAANPFSDCVDHWAESYIAYGVKTGIIAGIGGDKFAPEANVTGVQYLKMVLVVLGYDAKVEGLEGKNWDVNTLALAKRVGLTATLGNKFDYTADLTREEAAVIMLDALRADVVEYGSRLGWNGDITEWPFTNGKTVYWTVAGAVSTGDKLMKAWDLREGYTEDAFYRPYRTWEFTNGAIIGTYMFPVQAEYTTAYNMCDVLVDLGVAKTNITSKINIASHFVNGAPAPTSLVGEHWHELEGAAQTWNHGVCGSTTSKGGAQGTLTQVFYMGGGEYRITEIDTWLGVVTSAKKVSTNRDGHLTSYTVSTIDAIGMAADDKSDCGNRNIDDAALKDLTTTVDGLKKDDVVLVSISAKVDNSTQTPVSYAGKAYYTVAAKSALGTLDGYKLFDYPSQTRIDGVYVNDSLHFHEGYHASKTAANFGSTKLFYYDRYDNVIGMVTPAAGAKDYLVIDRLWLTSEKGNPVLYADVVTIDGTVTKDVKVATYTSTDWGTAKPKDFIDDFGDQASNAFAQSNAWAYNNLDTYGVDEDGLYYITERGAKTYDDIVIVAGNPEVTVNNTKVFATNAATKYLIHENNGTYTAVTGFRAVDSLKAGHAQFVDDNGDNIADIVYIWGGVVRSGDTAIAYVTAPATDWVEYYAGTPYVKMVIYVDGAATEVYVDADDAFKYFAGPNAEVDPSFKAGFFAFHYLTVGKNTFVEVVKDADTVAYVDGLNKEFHVASYADDVLSVKEGDRNYAVAADVVVYSVRVDGTVVKEDAAKYVETYGLKAVKLVFNAKGEVAEVYSLEDKNY